jgi:hypothetical protein
VLTTPLAVLQIIAGLRVSSGGSRWLWLALACGVASIGLALSMTGGFAAPIAWASFAINGVGAGIAIVAAATKQGPA